MPAVCKFYGYTPSQFWQLSSRDYADLVQYMKKWIEAQKK